MQIEHIKYLVCPKCFSDLEIQGNNAEGHRILEGKLICIECKKEYSIVNGIPIFVDTKNYSENFGFEWNTHNKTQYDHYSQTQVSKIRFEKETKWTFELQNEVIIEAGCGSGRFTEYAVNTKAMVISFDYSTAVKANYQSNGHYDNLLIVQASILEMPFKDGIADKLFCFGVLQHTPDPETAFACLAKKIKINGTIAADIYRFELIDIFKTKYWIRPFIKKNNYTRLYSHTCSYIDFMWPFASLIMKVFPNKIGRKINWQLLIPDYSEYKLDTETLKEWAYLDIFDMLSPKYDKPKSLKTFRSWFSKYGFQNCDVHYGYNGIEGRGIKTAI
jgi:SAM-dependent methyltransferase